MGSLIPFQDLNLVPESATITITSTSTMPTATINLKIPKIEPKVEPLDEFYETQQALQTQEPQKTTLFPSPSPEALLNSQFSTVSSEENRTPLSQASSGISLSKTISTPNIAKFQSFFGPLSPRGFRNAATPESRNRIREQLFQFRRRTRTRLLQWWLRSARPSILKN